MTHCKSMASGQCHASFNPGEADRLSRRGGTGKETNMYMHVLWHGNKGCVSCTLQFVSRHSSTFTNKSTSKCILILFGPQQRVRPPPTLQISFHTSAPFRGHHCRIVSLPITGIPRYYSCFFPAPSGSHPGFAISKLLKSKPGATEQPTSVQSPRDRACCHSPRPTMTCGL